MRRSRTPALHHAAPSVLDAIDRVQRRFLREIGLDELSALLQYKLAPLSARRDVAMLGLLHRVSHGRAPDPPADLLTGAAHARPAHSASTRSVHLRHDRQMLEYVSRGGHTEALRRSTFGLITVWNLLPPYVANAQATKTYQRHLQHGMINRAKQFPDSDWPHFFSSDARTMPINTFHQLFA